MDFLELKAERTTAYYSELAEKAKYDSEAFAELYDFYFPRVYNYVFGKLKNRDLADDVISITFERALMKLDSFDSSRGAFSTWLFRIAGNELTNIYRHTSYKHEAEWDDFFDPADDRKTPEQEILATEGKSALLMALDKLNENERKVIALKYFSDLSNKDIATQLGMTTSNVGVILHRSLDKLKKILEKNYDFM